MVIPIGFRENELLEFHIANCYRFISIEISWLEKMMSSVSKLSSQNNVKQAAYNYWIYQYKYYSIYTKLQKRCVPLQPIDKCLCKKVCPCETTT